MASIQKVKDSSKFTIRFRFQGRNIHRSLGTGDRRKATGICSRIEETLHLLETGRIEVPTGSDPIEFIFADGKKPQKKPAKGKSLGLMAFHAAYKEKLPAGRKEASTLDGEEIHLNHFKRHLGPSRTVQSITKSDLQNYVSSRLKEKHHGKHIQPDTVRKELVTFRMLWNWGVEEGLLVGPSPTKHVALPLTDEKPPFMTRKEIEAIVARGGLTEDDENRLWEAVYLESAEVAQVLEHVRKNAQHPFIYPMMVFVAHTSARRSEMVRSMIEDIDFRSGTVVLREKKKSRTKAMTYRRVDMSPLLHEVMQNWMKQHPGGQRTFCQLRRFRCVTPLTLWQAQHHLKQTMKEGEWSFITSFRSLDSNFSRPFCRCWCCSA